MPGGGHARHCRRSIHYPPETATVFLLTRILAILLRERREAAAAAASSGQPPEAVAAAARTLGRFGSFAMNFRMRDLGTAHRARHRTAFCGGGGGGGGGADHAHRRGLSLPLAACTEVQHKFLADQFKNSIDLLRQLTRTAFPEPELDDGAAAPAAAGCHGAAS